MSSETSNYQEAYSLYEQLHILINDGRGEGVNADDLRDRLDPVWYKLTDEEQAKLRIEVGNMS